MSGARLHGPARRDEGSLGVALWQGEPLAVRR